jgi:hypothetical protein
MINLSHVYPDGATLKDRIILGAVVLLIGVVIGLALWLANHRGSAGEPGFPPGWHCTQYDVGAEVCERQSPAQPSARSR